MKPSARLDTLIQQMSALLPELRQKVDWGQRTAAVWRNHWFGGQLRTYGDIDDIALDDMLHINEQKLALDLNTRQFIAGLPANHALLWGARGSGKSSLVHAVLNQYKDRRLRLIQVDKHDMTALPDIVERVHHEPYRFILFCDDLSLDDKDLFYQALKSTLEGSVFTTSSNVLIYATSNRRHLLPESMLDNASVAVGKYEIHHGEAVEEKISLSDRFGLWLAFHAFSQDEYLNIAEHWVSTLALAAGSKMRLNEQAKAEAKRWALKRGSRSGRSAQHFARHWVGRKLLHDRQPR